MLLLASFLLVPPAPADASADVQPPTVLTVSLVVSGSTTDSTSITIDGAAEKVIVRVSAVDNEGGSGLASAEGAYVGNLEFTSPGVAGDRVTAWADLRTTATPGVFEAEVEFGPFVESGVWRLSYLAIRDQANNWRNYSSRAALLAAGFDVSVSVTNPDQDVTPPNISSVALLPPGGGADPASTVDLAIDGDPVTVMVRVLASDSGGAGMASALNAYVGNIEFTSPGIAGASTTIWADVRGTGTAGVFEAAVTFGAFVEPGAWQLTYVSLRDLADNWRNLSGRSAVLAAGIDVRVDVSNVGSDVLAPTVESLEMSAQSVDVADGEQTVTVTVRAVDLGLAGMASTPGAYVGNVEFESPGIAGHSVNIWADLRATDDPAIFSGTVTFGAFVEAGAWQLSYLSLRDLAGNWRTYGGTDRIWQAGLSSTVVVLRGAAVPPPPEGWARLTGTIEDDAGPVPGALIQLQSRPNSERGWNDVRRVKTAADGTYILDVDLTLLVQRRLIISPPPARMDPSAGMLPAFEHSLDLPAGTTSAALDLEFPAANVAGVVRDLDGTAIEGARIRPNWTRLDDWRAGSPGGVTSGPGGYFALAFSPLELPYLVLDISMTDDRDRRLLDFTIDLLDRSASDLLALDATFPPPEVAGVVRRSVEGVASPVPVEGARIIIESREDEFSGWWWQAGWSRLTDTLGRFWLRIDDHPDQRYRVRVEAPSPAIPGVPSFLQVVDREDLSSLDLVFPDANIIGMVRDPESQRVANASVELEVLIEEFGYSNWQSTGLRTRTDGQGRLWMHLAEIDERLADGERIRLRISPEWGSGEGLAEFLVDLEAGMDLAALELQFPVPNISGTVLDFARAPARHAHLSLEREVSQFGHTYWTGVGNWTSTNADGSFWMFVEDPDPGANYRITVRWWGGGLDYSFDVNVVPGDPGALGLVLEFPEPNISGVLLGDLGDGPEPIADAWFEVRRWMPQFDSWEGVGVYGSSRTDGSFALYLSPDLPPGQYSVRVEPPRSRRGQLPAFSFAVSADGSAQGLDRTFPQPNLSGVVYGPSGDIPVIRASIVLERRVVEAGGVVSWQYVEWLGETGDMGRFARLVESLPPDVSHRLRVSPSHGFSGRGLAEFTVPLPTTGSTTDLVIRFPEPDLRLTIIDNDGSPVRGTWVNVARWDDQDAGWRWDASRLTLADGEAVFIVGDGTIRLSVESPWNRGDLVPFDVQLTAADRADGTILLRFPTPNLNGRFVDAAGQGVPYAWFDVEVLTPEGDWTWTRWQRSADVQGRFSLLIDEPGEYRMSVSPSWSLGLAQFTQRFAVDASGVVSGLGEIVAFPDPNVTLTIAGGSDEPIAYAGVWVQRWDPARERWRDQVGGVSTSRSGVASFLLEPGTYRAIVSPPWYVVDLVGTVEEFEVPASGTFSRTIRLREPNVTGSVELEEGVPAPWSWIGVLETTSDAPYFHIEAHGRLDGSFVLSLPEGQHELRVWSGSRFELRPIDIVVTVDGSEQVTGWRYALQSEGVDNCTGSPCTVDVSFDAEAIRPNLIGRLVAGDDPVTQAFLTFRGEDFEETVGVDDAGRFGIRVPDGVEVTLEVTLVDGEQPVVIVLSEVLVPGGPELTIDLG